MIAASVTSDTKRSAINFLRVWPALALVAILLVFFAHEYNANRLVKPPHPNCTLKELAAKVSPPAHIALVTQHGAQRLVWIGTIPRLTIRSGPPCYIFDERGRLVDWCPETGEGWPLDNLVTAAYKLQPMSLDEALRWYEERRK